MTKLKKISGLMATLGILGVVISISAQSTTSTSDADQIQRLMRSLSDHSKSPADLLDPSLSPNERQKFLKHFATSHYDLSLTPTSGIPAATGDFLSVPVRVQFDGRDGNTLDANATAQFVKEGRGVVLRELQLPILAVLPYRRASGGPPCGRWVCSNCDLPGC